MHCDTCSKQVKPRRSEVPRYHVSGEKYTVLGFTVTAHVEHASQCTSCTDPVKTKWQRTRSSESDEYHYEFDVINSYFHSIIIFNGNQMWRIVKLYGFLSSQNDFLEQKGISVRALIHVAKTESLSTCHIFSKLLPCRQFCQQNACRRQHYSISHSRMNIHHPPPPPSAEWNINPYIHTMITEFNLMSCLHVWHDCMHTKPYEVDL